MKKPLGGRAFWVHRLWFRYSCESDIAFTYEESRSETFVLNGGTSLRTRVGHEGSGWAVQQVAVNPAYSRPYRDEALFFLKATGGLCSTGWARVDSLITNVGTTRTTTGSPVNLPSMRSIRSVAARAPIS